MPANAHIVELATAVQIQMILLHTALKHWSYLCGEGWGGTLILSYISRFGPFLEVQNFNYIFLEEGGGWVGKVRKINMFGGMMKL